MKKKNLSRFMALAMTGVMLCSPIAVSADVTTEEKTTAPGEGSATGAGSLEGYLDEKDEIFKVVLPTDDGKTFEFKMDPQHLLNKTDSGTYKDADATVIFGNKTGTSEALTIVNKSQFDVDCSLTATMTGLSGEGYDIKMAADNKFKDADQNDIKDTSLYLGLIYSTTEANSVAAVSDGKAALVAGESGLTQTVTLGGMPDKYEPKKDGSGKYTYVLKTDATNAKGGDATIKLEGACNPNANWSAIDDLETPAAPTVKIAWKLDRHVDGPTATMTAGGLITLKNLTADKNFTSYDNITLINGDQRANVSGDNATFDAGTWTAENGGTCSVQLSSAWTAWNSASVSAVITLSDGTQIDIPAVTLSVQ
mgnify:CR=1 FL=1